MIIRKVITEKPAASEKNKNESCEIIMPGAITYGDSNKGHFKESRRKSIIDDLLPEAREGEKKSLEGGGIKYWEKARNYVSKKSNDFMEFDPSVYASEKWGGVKESVYEKYGKIKESILEECETIKDAFSSNISKEGMKANVKYMIVGGTAFGAERFSDVWANWKGGRDAVSYVLSGIPGEYQTGMEGFVRDYFTMGGIQNNVLPSLNIASGTFTNDLAYAGAFLTGVSLLALVGKEIIRKSKRKKGEPVDKIVSKDVGDVIKDNKKKFVLAVGGGVIGAAAAPTSAPAFSVAKYVASAMTSFFSAASMPLVSRVPKKKKTQPGGSWFSGVKEKLTDFYYNAEIL